MADMINHAINAELNAEDAEGHDCEKCNQPMRPGQANWMCLSNKTHRYHPHDVKPEADSQGWFPLCNRCSADELMDDADRMSLIITLAEKLRDMEAIKQMLHEAHGAEMDYLFCNAKVTARRMLVDALRQVMGAR